MFAHRILQFGLGSIAVGLLFILVLVVSPEAQARTDQEREASRIERETKREARRIEREQRQAERAARRLERDQEESDEETTCNCRARLRFNRPRLTFVNNTLAFVPSFDLDVKTKGGAKAPSWAATIALAGSALYESRDIIVPQPTIFRSSNNTNIFPCGTQYEHNGLSSGPLPLTGLGRDLLSGKQTLEGILAMNVTVSIPACSFEQEEQKQFSFDFEAFGNHDVGTWRNVR